MPDVLLRNIDSTIQADYERFVFNKPFFLSQFSDLSVQSFYLFNTESQKRKAEIHFIIHDQIAYSPWRGSFGSYQISEKLEESDLLNFHRQVEISLIELQVNKIVIRNYPQVYAPKQAAMVSRLLLSQNYSLLYSDQNYHLNLHVAFEEKLKQSENNRLRLLSKNGFQSEYWVNPDLEELYQVLMENRSARGYAMSMDFESFREMFSTLPGTYYAFRTVYQQNTIAVAVCVHINSDILYNFYIGELPEYRKYSPVVGLLKYIHYFARMKNYRTLDLGIASEKGLINAGLAKFKENMGAELSAKELFEKVI